MIVSNPSGDRNDSIYNAAKILGRSKDRKKVFIAIYYGKKKEKTVSEIAEYSKLSKKRVLEEAIKLYAGNIIGKSKKKGEETVYEKKDFYTQNKKQILKLCNNKNKLDNFPTKTNPKPNGYFVKVVFPQKKINHKAITIDDIDSFSKVKRYKSSRTFSKQLAESTLKLGFQNIIGEKGKFTDWGGEINDLFSSRVILNGKRVNTAIAFKGKATKGNLTPKKLGKNGDQIQRLFRSTAEVFLIQYQGLIDQSIIEQMKAFAIAKSVTEGVRIYYGVIDIQDTSRLLQAYPNQFK